MELPPLDEYISRIGRIIGVDLNDDDAPEMPLEWTNAREGRILFSRLSLMQQRLLSLKDEMEETIDQYRTTHPTGRSMIERQKQEEFLSFFSRVKHTITKYVESFDEIKKTIEECCREAWEASDPYRHLSKGDMLKRYFIYLFEEVSGPFDLLDLLAERDAGLLKNETLCTLEGTENWVPFIDVAGERNNSSLI